MRAMQEPTHVHIDEMLRIELEKQTVTRGCDAGGISDYTETFL